ncbi:O-antigen ligase family protein [Sphingomicrobium lutaoense]|uniref:O-antigen ligase n=1 Tax=Sphingomicrobium lutaoense TaxID=515949 RepID=A0A839Z1H1_9SPHN|nr:O-antigen ligase family protein [Sphingomicrobium lutaoense]MBB3763522.1 O-antigen ligase [Sphingomicrobium lutaoense]
MSKLLDVKANGARSTDHYPIGPVGIAALTLFALATIIGGGGADGPLGNGILAFGGAGLIAMTLAAHFNGRRRLPSIAWPTLGLMIGLAALVVFQLWAFNDRPWDDAPLRGSEQSVLGLIGAADEARSLSLDPEATKRSALMFLLPFGLVLAALGARIREIRLWLWIAVAGGLVNATVGVLQLILGLPDWLQFYASRSLSMASGLFANHNHFAHFLALGMIASGALIAIAPARVEEGSSPRPRDKALWLAVPYMALGIIASGSRAGLILGAVALALAIVIALPPRRSSRALGLVMLIPIALLIVMSIYPSAYANAFDEAWLNPSDLRITIVPDTLYVLQGYFPWGSGLGTFVPVFASQENLDHVVPAYVNHAHNDWLEWILEAGAPGFALLAGLFGLLAFFALRQFLRRKVIPGYSWRLFFAGAGILFILSVHSAFDYPIRIAAIAAMSALAIALMGAGWMDLRTPREATRRSGMAVIGSGLAVAGVVAILILPIQLAQAAFRSGDSTTAAQLRPSHGQAVAILASEAVRAREAARSQALAAHAIRNSPMNQAAVRSLAVAQELSGQDSSAAWLAAASLGWRDAPTQLWALGQALTNEEFEVAALRADAYMRTRQAADRRPEVAKLVRIAANEPGFRVAITNRLAKSPDWRRQVFQLAAESDPREINGALALIAAMEKSDLPASIAEAAPLIQALIAAGRAEEAFRVDRLARDLPQNQSRLAGGDLSHFRLRRPLSPFEWGIHSGTNVEVAVEGADNPSVLIETHSSEGYPALRRLAMLRPGLHRMEWSEWSFDADTSPVRARVSCVGGPRIAQSQDDRISASPQRKSMTFQVQPSCPLLQLAFVTVETREPTSAQLDDIEVSRLTSPK